MAQLDPPADTTPDEQTESQDDTAPALDSPRATMFTFLEAMNAIIAGEGNQTKQWDKALAAIEFPRSDNGLTRGEQRRIAHQLLDVLDRIGEVQREELPDAQAARERSLESYTYFPRRDTGRHQRVQQKLEQSLTQKITMVRVDGGAWKFSEQTIEELPQLHEVMMQLPAVYQRDLPEVVNLLGPTFARTPYWGWLALLGAIFVGVVAGKIVSVTLRKLAERWRQRNWRARAAAFDDMASPISLAILATALFVGLHFIHMDEMVTEFSWKILQFLYILAVGWLLYNLVDVLDVVLRDLTSSTETRMDDMVVPLIRKTLRIFLVVIFTLVVAQNVFGLNITGWLAGLGIAGLAVSLAAQDSVKNLFGSMTIFFDKPFLINDFIKFDDETGTVEEIGFRSTRIRLLSGHLVTVPNMKFIDSKVENISARPYIRRQLDVTITYDTPAEKIEQAVQLLRDILHDSEVVEQGKFDMENFPPRIAFNDYNSASLNIRVFYWYQMAGDPDRGFFTFLDHSQLVNMKLFRAYAEAGIEFAFPTQTLYLAGDPNRELNVNVLSSDKG